MGKAIDTFFRANVGAVILNANNEVLAFERTKIKNAWQLPQGGLDEGEEPYDTAVREVFEETAIKVENLELLAEYPDWLVYELPKEYRSKKMGRGQAQRWFFFRINKEIENKIDLTKAEEKEFADWKWMSMDELCDIVVEFRKPIYSKLNEFMKENI